MADPAGIARDPCNSWSDLYHVVKTDAPPFFKKYGLPLFALAGGLASTIGAGFCNATGQALFLTAGAAFFAFTIGSTHHVIRNEKKNALKIVTFLALSILFAELALMPTLGHSFMPAIGHELTFSLSASATLFLALAIREAVEKKSELAPVLASVVSFIIGAEFVAIEQTMQSAFIASVGVLALWIISGAYVSMKENSYDNAKIPKEFWRPKHHHKEFIAQNAEKITTYLLLTLFFGEMAGFANLGQIATIAMTALAIGAAGVALHTLTRSWHFKWITPMLIFGVTALMAHFGMGLDKIDTSLIGGGLGGACILLAAAHAIDQEVRKRMTSPSLTT